MAVAINDHEISGVVIDDGSEVNIISEATCLDLGLRHWEPCPFHLRMADNSAVHPLGLMTKIPIWIGGEFFEISAVVLYLSDQGRYPLLLGRP